MEQLTLRVVFQQFFYLNVKKIYRRILKRFQVLREILKKCLQEGDNKNMGSIAFASIGTGTLQFPRDQVADIYFDEVMSFSQKNPTTSVRDVRFVLHDKDTQTIQSFQAVELARNSSAPSFTRKGTDSHQRRGGKNGASSKTPGTFSTITERKPNNLETTVGSLCFQVQPGDITKETTDAIAVVSNSQLDLSTSGAGSAILRSGGGSIAKECSENAPQTPGSVVITSAGNLTARYLFHIVPSDRFPADMSSCLTQCLQEAERKRISSISFPAVGTGILGVPAKTCAHAMLSAILELSKETPKSLKLVKMTIFQESMINDIRLAMEEASGAKSYQESGWRKANVPYIVYCMLFIAYYILYIVYISFRGFKTVASAVLGFGRSDVSANTSANTQETDSRKIDLLLYAGCKKDLQGALKAVSELMKENCKQKVIEHEAIKRLTQEHMHRIHTLELRYSVEVTVEKQVERIVLDGQSEDILQVVGEIHEILHEVKENEHERSHAEVLSKDVQWKYIKKGKFEDYESEANAKIELAYQQKKSYVSITCDGEEYKIRFDAMTEEDEEGYTTKVRRIDLRKGT